MPKTTIRIDPDESNSPAIVYVDGTHMRLSVGEPGAGSRALVLTPFDARQLAGILQAAADAVEAVQTEKE